MTFRVSSFGPSPTSTERDVRFIYCAFVICHLLNAFHSIRLNEALNYLLRCRVSHMRAYRRWCTKAYLISKSPTTMLLVKCLTWNHKVRSLPMEPKSKISL